LRNVNIAKESELTAYFVNAANMANGVASSLQPAIDGGFGEAPLGALGLPEEQIAQMAAGLGMTPEQISGMSVSQVQTAFYGAAAQANGAAAGVKQLTDTNLKLDTKQTGIGVTPILGFNFNWRNLNVGIKYEFITKMTLTNKTDEGANTTGIADFDDGVKTPYDIPALLTVGAQYQIASVKVSAGYHHFFESHAKMAEVKDPTTGNLVGKQTFITNGMGGMNEYLLGAEWQINHRFLISAGTQFSRTGVTDDYQTDMNYSLNAYSIGLGGRIKVVEKVHVNLAYFFTKYEDWTKKSANYYGLPLPGTDVFSRTNQVIGIGVDFKL